MYCTHWQYKWIADNYHFDLTVVYFQAANTYMLALDGDVDFKPDAVRLLVDLLKKNKKVGAACGRIHPIGSGACVYCLLLKTIFRFSFIHLNLFVVVFFFFFLLLPPPFPRFLFTEPGVMKVIVAKVIVVSCHVPAFCNNWSSIWHFVITGHPSAIL